MSEMNVDQMSREQLANEVRILRMDLKAFQEAYRQEKERRLEGKAAKTAIANKLLTRPVKEVEVLGDDSDEFVAKRDLYGDDETGWYDDKIRERLMKAYRFVDTADDEFNDECYDDEHGSIHSAMSQLEEWA